MKIDFKKYLQAVQYGVRIFFWQKWFVWVLPWPSTLTTQAWKWKLSYFVNRESISSISLPKIAHFSEFEIGNVFEWALTTFAWNRSWVILAIAAQNLQYHYTRLQTVLVLELKQAVCSSEPWQHWLENRSWAILAIAAPQAQRKHWSHLVRYWTTTSGERKKGTQTTFNGKI